jgi:hypothetical protein
LVAHAPTERPRLLPRNRTVGVRAERFAADKHWLTDVLAGAAVGVAVGVFVPLVFHSAIDDPARSTPAVGTRPPLPLVAIAW